MGGGKGGSGGGSKGGCGGSGGGSGNVGGGSTSKGGGGASGMMVAPGSGGAAIISRGAFESNPQGYFAVFEISFIVITCAFKWVVAKVDVAVAAKVVAEAAVVALEMLEEEAHPKAEVGLRE
ncbi:probable H/ACA ribonucleoprotein complex subunit 1 [Gossypium hirsutum]|uniref:Probable H/ACA ribonucleoprotein complex subunit 1 n=1 Tax=Gossypium hirsutum TaxID=3635 RepID=A0ABM3BBZ0_GOSHI|nr:probable H/ACA ribonucleoprotein complex subunit 1 [Gossypium hirsutum]